ncbi:MAG: DNA repair protein RadA [Alphaproteobacteria bacterium]
MAKPPASQFICQACGCVHRRWQGRCDGCGEWNSIVEEIQERAPPLGTKASASARGRKGRAVEFVSLAGQQDNPPRLSCGSSEFDRVLGGGLVAGQAVLIGGDPGIGKSTLLLQATANLSMNANCLYISGEESVDQIRMRASRLGVQDRTVGLATATNVADIQAAIAETPLPAVAVIDSIQTMYVEGIEAAPGSVTQVRASAQELIRSAKARGASLLLVGHVTKDGAIAGPRVLEHMVDSVLYFEGERGHAYRILRSIKNRFGPANEIGVFDMTEAGLMEVSNPSALFLSERQAGISGAAVFAGIEGSRPMLVEIQALVAPSPLGTPRRAVVGWDSNRLAMLLAVLETRGGINLAGRDVYLNVAGGLKINEPAADLAVASAIISSCLDVVINEQTVIFGEVGLSGEVRSVSQPDARSKEAQKLGFKTICGPPMRGKKAKSAASKKDHAHFVPISDVAGLIAYLTEGAVN